MTPQAPHHESAEDPLLPIALAIGDGVDVDWTRVADATPPSDDQAELDRMRRLERLVRGHELLRRQTPAGPDPSADETLLTEARRRAAASTPLDAVRVRWGPLEVLEKVGSGAFGDVYRAWEPRLQREVALKLVPDAAPADVATPVIEEGRLLARIRHANVLTVYGAERIDGRVGIWTEFVRGETLAAAVVRRGPLPVREAAAIGIDVARALDAVHTAGVLHRDVKAQNVMRDDGGRVVLGDFGIGVMVEGSDAAGRPPAGTPVYLAPEVLAHGPASVASDLYSLGVLLYFLVTGDYPVRVGTLDAIRAAHESGQRVPIDRHRADLPRAFIALVNALLDPVPARRPASAAAVEAALTGIPTGLDGSRSRGRLLPAPGAAALVTIAVAGVVVVLWSLIGGTEMTTPAKVIELTMRAIVDAPCMGAPEHDGRSIVCVESALHLENRGAKGPRPLVRFSLETGQMDVLYQPLAPAQIHSVVRMVHNRSVAFVERGEVQSTWVLKVLDLETGSPRTVREWPPATMAVVVNDWHQADDRLSVRLWRQDNTQAFLLVSPTTGVVETEFDFPGSPQGFSRSPDGRRLAFDVMEAPDRPARDIQVCELATRVCAPVASHPGHDFYPIWAGDGQLLFNSDRSGLMGLYLLRFDSQGQPTVPRLVREVGRVARPIGLTADGTLFAQLMSPRFDVQVIDLSAGAASSAPVRLPGPASYDSKSPVWSPSGDRLAYVAQRAPFADPGAMRVVVRSMQTGQEVDFTFHMPLNSARLAWSPDGALLAVRGVFGLNTTSREAGIQIIDAASGRVVSWLPGPAPAFAWLDSQTLLNTAKGVVRGIDVATGGERAIWRPSPPHLIRTIAVSPDGAWLAVTVGPVGPAEWCAIVVLPSSGGMPRELLREPGCWGQAWSRDGAAVLVTRRVVDAVGRSTSQLWRVLMDGSTPEPLPLLADDLDEIHPHPKQDRYAFTARRSAPPEYWTFTGLTR